MVGDGIWGEWVGVSVTVVSDVRTPGNDRRASVHPLCLQRAIHHCPEWQQVFTLPAESIESIGDRFKPALTVRSRPETPRCYEPR